MKHSKVSHFAMKKKDRRDKWDKMEKEKYRKDGMKHDWKMNKKIEAKMNHEPMKKKKHGKEIGYCSDEEESEIVGFNHHGKNEKYGKKKMSGDYEKKDELKCASKKKKILDEESSSFELKQKEKMRKGDKKRKDELKCASKKKKILDEESSSFELKQKEKMRKGDKKRKDELKCASKKKKILDEESSSLELKQKEKMRKEDKKRKREKKRKKNFNYDFGETKDQKLNLSFEDKEMSGYYSTIPQGSAFFKIMLQSFDEYMYIPPSFAEEIESLVYQPIYLKHCNERYWTVYLNLKHGCLAFRQGWHDFVINHSITERELLIFTYEGDSVFTVRIFGVDCKERICAQKNRKGTDGKRKEPETQFEGFHCDKKQRHYGTYGEMESSIFDSSKKKVPSVAEKVTKAFKHENKCNSSWKNNPSKTKKTAVKEQNSVKKKTGNHDTNQKKKEQKVTKTTKNDEACNSKLFNGLKKANVMKKDKKKMVEKHKNTQTDPNDGLCIQKDKNLGEGRRRSGKLKLGASENINGCQGTEVLIGHENDNQYQGSEFFAAPVCPLPINAFMSYDEYSCTSCTEKKTTDLNNLHCDFLVDEYGVCHATDEIQTNEVNGNMFHSDHEMKHNASKKYQIQLTDCSKRVAIKNQNFCDKLIIRDKNNITGKEEKDMTCISPKKPSGYATYRNMDVKNTFSPVPATFRYCLAIPSRNDWIKLHKKLPVPENCHGRHVIMLRSSLCKLWPVLYIQDRFFVGFTGGWKSFVEANCFREGDFVEFMELPGSQYTLQLV